MIVPTMIAPIKTVPQLTTIAIGLSTLRNAAMGDLIHARSTCALFGELLRR